MTNKIKMTLLGLVAFLTILIGTGIGSVFVPPSVVAKVLWKNLFWGRGASDPLTDALISGLRLPRVLMAFLAGAALSVGGTVMQSLLRNPLASPFGLGVSSGAGLGVMTALLFGVSGVLRLPGAGLCGAVLSVCLVMRIALHLDRNLSNMTVILTGMVVSLFLNAVMSLVASVSRDRAQQILLWTLGSFSGKTWAQVKVLFCVTVSGCIFLGLFGQVLDICTFGEETATALGISLRRVKGQLFFCVAILTGTATAFAGVIGFVDLIAPHVTRRIFGASHRRVVPASALVGGTFMVWCDMASRTLMTPREIPVGSVTALLGAPFFLYVFSAGRRKGKC